MLKLNIPNEIYGKMLQQTKAEAPLEACGILAGQNGQVKRFYPMTNADQSNDHYMMVPKEQFEVVKDIRASGLEMLAIYHSHPETPARPSKEDLRLALTPDVIYVIVSLQNIEPVIKGFLIEDNKVVSEISVRIEVKKK